MNFFDIEDQWSRNDNLPASCEPEESLPHCQLALGIISFVNMTRISAEMQPYQQMTAYSTSISYSAISVFKPAIPVLERPKTMRLSDVVPFMHIVRVFCDNAVSTNKQTNSMEQSSY
jgi:hypothetical protein